MLFQTCRRFKISKSKINLLKYAEHFPCVHKSRSWKIQNIASTHIFLDVGLVSVVLRWFLCSCCPFPAPGSFLMTCHWTCYRLLCSLDKHWIMWIASLHSSRSMQHSSKSNEWWTAKCFRPSKASRMTGTFVTLHLKPNLIMWMTCGCTAKATWHN